MKKTICKQTGDFDQMLYFAAPDLGPHCLLMSPQKDARLIYQLILSMHDFLSSADFFLSKHRRGEQTVGTTCLQRLSADDTIMQYEKFGSF